MESRRRPRSRAQTPRRRISAGVAVYRTRPGPAVLLVRETRGFGRGTWGIPKGAVEPGECLEQAARREAREETGLVLPGRLEDLGSVDHERPYGRTRAYATPAPRGARPAPALPEVDRAEFVDLDLAVRLVHPDQRPLVDELRRRLRARPSGRRPAAILDAEIDDYLREVRRARAGPDPDRASR